MSATRPGFRGWSIEDVQRRVFLRDLPGRSKGRWHYQRSGLHAPPGTVVLFQFQARIIASATFPRDEKFDRPKRGNAGVLHFAADSFRTFDPLDVAAMRKIWPGFRAFGHVKQYLNPTLHSKLSRRLKVAAKIRNPKSEARKKPE
ncbi:hypothetical protein BH09PLA1_BH09PLA1_10280 [soil metagenome]